MHFGNPIDLQFMNPQVFLQAQYYSTQHEFWDVFKKQMVKVNRHG